MKLTPALSVRHLLAKLHPPLPKTPRESQQLLNILETSFRKHLDEVHPSPAQRNVPSAPQSDIPLASLDSSSHATHQYLSTVLSNPLLARHNAQDQAQPSLTTSSLHAFSQALLEGKISIPLIRRCAGDYLQGVKKGEPVSEKDQLTSKIASWIYMTNPSMRKAFLGSTDVLNIVTQVAEVDKQEAVVWDWLRIIYERDFGTGAGAGDCSLSDIKWLSVEDLLVSYIMRLSLRRGQSSDAAQHYVEACQYRTASERAAARQDDASETLTFIPMDHSWKRLAASIVYYRSKHNIPEDLFNRLVFYGMSWSATPQFSVPIVSIYHPTSPSAKSLYRHLKTPELANQFLLKSANSNKRFRRTTLLTLLDGAQVSLDQELREQAQFILDFASTHYSEFLPTLQQRTDASLDTLVRNAKEELQSYSHNFAWT